MNLKPGNGSINHHAILTAEQKQHDIFENISEYWVLCDFQGNFIESSITHRKELNISEDDLVGLNIMDFLHEEMRETMLSALEEVKQKGKLSGIVHLKLKDGNHRSYEYKIVVLHNDEEPVAIRILAWDITEAVRNKKALEASEARYRSVFENTGLPTVILEEDLLISMVNARFVDMSGYAKDEVEGKMYLTHFIAEVTHDAIVKDLRGRFDESPSEFECRITNRRGEAFDVIVRFGCISSTRQKIASFTDITAHKKAEQELLQSKEHLQEENIMLRSSLKECFRFGDIIGKSRVMQDVYEVIVKAAESNANVIIYGESGTGKELVARAIHQLSRRKDNRLVTVNCGAIPENIIESEFFGYKKGAFTGANNDKLGYLDYADGGTLFLDEVGELDTSLQVKLLRAIEGAGYIPLGSNEARKKDVRIIAATNRNLKELIKEKYIREDFFYRIHIIPIYLPPLRERKEDIPLLIDFFMNMYGNHCPPITGRLLDDLRNYNWPGNVRELQNVIHRYVSMQKLDFAGSSPAAQKRPEPIMKPADASTMKDMLDAYEKQLIENALEKHQWNRSHAAAGLGINRRTLFTKMMQYGLQKTQNGAK